MSTKESPAFTWQQILEDVPAPKGGYGLPNQSPNLAPGLIPPQPLHSRPEESDFTSVPSHPMAPTHFPLFPARTDPTPSLAGILCPWMMFCSGNCQWRAGTRAGRDEGHSRSMGLQSLCQGLGLPPGCCQATGTLWAGLLLPQCPRIMTSVRLCAEASVSGLSQGLQMQDIHPLCTLWVGLA